MSGFHLSRISRYIFYKHLQDYGLVSTFPESFKVFKNKSKVSLITLNYDLERKLKSLFQRSFSSSQNGSINVAL